MAHGALLAAADAGIEIAGGIVVGPDAISCDSPVECVVGDHPVPGPRSHRAAMRIGAMAHAVLPEDHVLLLVSGGTSSLIAAPIDGIDAAALDTLFGTLLAAGRDVDIHVMNAVRRRFLRWGGGRLAAALAPARIHQVLLSDVIGDDPAVIGSGPAVPDPLVAREVLDLLDAHVLTGRIEPVLTRYLHDVANGSHPETPKATDALFANVDAPVVLGRARLHTGIAGRARTLGATLYSHDEPLTGEARERGSQLARWLATSAPAGIHCWSGETSVTLGSTHGSGGRCQELALSAALTLDALAAGERRVTLLAAGTDGRDGPTDAAGAIIDASTAAAARARGANPADALARHDSHSALDAAQSLLRTGPTGTNVADIVLSVIEGDAVRS